MTDMGRADVGAVVYGVVRFEPGGGRPIVREVFVLFESATAADGFAVGHGWPDYQVCPIRFFREDPPVPVRVFGNEPDAPVVRAVAS